MPKVSVIVPIYGVEKYIKRCANSLFAQTLDDIEFIFIDDCSPDRSMELLKKEIDNNRPRFARKSWEVRTERMPTNSGQAAVRKHGIVLATGDYIIHCDSDDWVDSHMYEEMYNKAVNEKLDIVVCDYYRSDGNKHTIYKNGVAGLDNKEDFFKQLLTYRCLTSVWNKLVKRELYEKNEIIFPTNNMWEDFALSIQLFFYAKRIGYASHPLYYYFYNPNSICYSYIDSKQDQLQGNARLILGFLELKGVSEKYKNQIEFFKYMSRSELIPFTKERKYLNMWRNTYPEINKTFWKNPEFSLKEKVKFISIYMGIIGKCSIGF